MENASKALLIAAAVLIVILIIAFGMKIFNSTGDTSADAVQVGEAMASKSTSATLELMQGNNKTKEDVLKLLDYLEKNTSTSRVIMLYNADGSILIVDNNTSVIKQKINNGKYNIKIEQNVQGSYIIQIRYL